MKVKQSIVMCLVVAVCLTLAACGGWASNARASLLTANEAVNAYDDVAAELWKDAPTNDTSFERLERSMCFTYLIQDAIIEGWAIVSMVDHGIKKETDFGYWAAETAVVLDQLEDQLTAWEIDLPEPLMKAFLVIESLAGGVSLPDTEPPDAFTCKAVIDMHRGK